MLSGDDLTIVLFFVGTAISIAGTAMSAAGWRHPILIRGLFSLAGVCFVVGVAWPALKTVSPPATAMVNQVATNPVAWFVVLILGMTASLLLPKRGGRTPDLPEQGGPIANIHTVAQAPVSAPAPAPVPASTPTPITTLKPKKVFVNVSPSYLIGLYENKTTIQGDALAAAYIGNWIRVTGKVEDIFGRPDALFAQLFDNDGKLISAAFSAEESEKISHIARGDTITIQGEIASSENRRLQLVRCDLVFG
jgi:hypothetical protein